MTETRWPRRTTALLLLAAGLSPAAETGGIDEIVVTSQRREQPRADHAGNIAVLDEQTIAAVGHQHIHQLMSRAPGVWLSRGSGQEHLTAIRSPALTGAGSCGGFLFLEDGIPIRPAGFCNVNQMFELDTEQARRIEVIRGPGSALYGSNALHGIINVLSPAADDASRNMAAVETGSNDYLRVRASWSGGAATPALASFVVSDDGGFREDSGYTQAKLRLQRDWQLPASRLTTAFSATDLDQDTAGFIFGQDAWQDPALNRANLNPEAFREASSQRLYAIWQASRPGYDIDVRPYMRRTEMRFLQHFLPGQPLEQNDHVSVGAMTALTFEHADRRVVAGVDLEWSDIHLDETQDGPTEGSAFLRATRPEGRHYDYDVRALAIAPYVHADFDVSDRLTLSGGLRFEYLDYDYVNNMLAGNTRDDGTECGFGGCLYSRPASRSDDFDNVAPKLSLNYEIRPGRALYGRIARGFRAPQATELYRLQSGQEVADLDSETLDSIEVGLRSTSDSWFIDTAVFYMKKRDSVLRDAAGFNVSGASSRHLGAELDLDWQILRWLRLEIVASYARHEYAFDTVAARGETFASGNDIDTAPRWLGSMVLTMAPSDDSALGLEWVAIGEYYLDAENRFTYPGHDLVNLRAGFELSETMSVSWRLNNLLDEAYADRADYAFGNYRYFPGRGREWFVELSYTPGRASP